MLNEGVHLVGDLPLHLQLLHVADVARDRVLAEEVAHQDLFDVGLFAEARSCIRLVPSLIQVPHCVVLSQSQGLNGVHCSLVDVLIKF